VAANPQIKPADLGCESAENWQIHIHHRHCCFYSAHKLMITLPSHGGWKAASTKALQERRTTRAQGCIAAAVAINTTLPQCDSNLGPLTPQSDALTARLLRPAVHSCSTVAGRLTSDHLYSDGLSAGTARKSWITPLTPVKKTIKVL